MKKLLYSLLALPMLLMGSCDADMGTEPGSDPNPVVTLYSYEPTDASLNPDNDVIVRFATNSKVTSVKYICVPSSTIEDLINTGNDDALLKKVEEEGTAVEGIKPASYVDVVLKEIHGACTIVAVANGKKLGNNVTFTGLDWTPVTTGTFYYNNDVAPIEASEATLEICTTNDAIYRINGAFGEGTALKMEMLNLYATDADGKYRFFRVKPTATPWICEGFGTISVRDIGYWQGDSAYVTDYGYESGFYEDGNAFFYLNWYAPGKYLGYNYSFFVPD